VMRRRGLHLARDNRGARVTAARRRAVIVGRHGLVTLA
jgi:hypothetical protein